MVYVPTVIPYKWIKIYVVGGWTNPIENIIWVKMGSSSPIFGVKMKKSLKPPPRIVYSWSLSWLNCFFPPDFNRCNPGTIAGETTEECKHGILGVSYMFQHKIGCDFHHQPKMMESPAGGWKSEVRNDVPWCPLQTSNFTTWITAGFTHCQFLASILRNGFCNHPQKNTMWIIYL